MVKRFFRRLKKLAFGRPIISLVVLLIVVLVVLEATNTTFILHKRKVSSIPSNQPQTSQSSQSTSSSSASAQSTPAPSLQTSSKGVASTPASGNNGAGPITPTGNFVSNHSPGGANPTSEVSVCNTTPGAQCYIEFSKGAELKKLDVQTADAGGSASWNWDVASAGLGSGSWKITAVATLNGQTKTANDALALEVK